MTPEKLRVVDRITAYLSSGGLFNPELANHDAVRDLLIDARDAYAAALEELARVKRAIAESCDEQRGEYFGCRRAERAEAALAESERKCERLKFHAEAKVAELETALLGIKEYREKNPLGGPAKVFDAMADQIRAGDDYNAVLKEYGFCHEAELAKVKAHAEAMAKELYYVEMAHSPYMPSSRYTARAAYRRDFPDVVE